PLNCEIEAPLTVKNVAAVPSGPTKLNGPVELLLPAAWNRKVVFAGKATLVQESVVHSAEKPAAGFASLRDEIRFPEVTKPVFIYVLKPRSLPPVLVSA